MEKLANTGTAAIYKGDTRPKISNMEKWFTQLLENEKPKVASRPYLYGSDAGFCARRNVFLQKNDSIDAMVNSAGRGYMAIGVAFENLLSDALLRNRRLLAQGMRIVEMPELKISGKMDLLVLDPDSKLALLEVKTCGDLPVEPKPDHHAQVKTYAAVTGIDRVHLVYMSRKLQPLQPIPLRVFPIDVSYDSMHSVLTTACLSQRCVSIGKVPPVPDSFRKHTECHWCEFRDAYCHGSRPGLGDEPPSQPLPNLTPKEYIEELSVAKVEATHLMLGRPMRFVETVRKILDECSLTPQQYSALEKELF
jgi:hypothetical protein